MNTNKVQSLCTQIFKSYSWEGHWVGSFDQEYRDWPKQIKPFTYFRNLSRHGQYNIFQKNAGTL